uniref:Sugar phosphate transporter domain-containing protein n=1 Tax=Oryza barthii TaxID=65489 RepID=A0A0D3EK06_9ORYZ
MGVTGEKFQLGTVGALSLSVVSSVSIVICNKALMSSLGFNFATTLTSWHLLVTFCSLHVALCMKLFEHKPFDARTVMGFGVLNGISIGLLNLSLGFNSVGFYQMTKLAIIPCTVILETLFFRKKFSRNIQLSLSVLLFGVGVATVTDLQLNAVGSVLSLLAIITTCIAQIMTNTIQKKFKVSSTQLLYQSCPYQALTLFIVGPFLDGFLTNQNVFAFDYTSQVVFFIVLSCLISVSVNFSTFLVIGKTSPVTYQVLGHLKTCLVLAFGYVLLHDPFSWRNILGILIAVIGMVSYSYFCTKEAPPKPTEASPQLNQVKESESDPLISDSLSTAENGGNAGDDEALKFPWWNSWSALAAVIPPGTSTNSRIPTVAAASSTVSTPMSLSGANLAGGRASVPSMAAERTCHPFTCFLIAAVMAPLLLAALGCMSPATSLDTVWNRVASCTIRSSAAATVVFIAAVIAPLLLAALGCMNPTTSLDMVWNRVASCTIRCSAATMSLARCRAMSLARSAG